MVRNCQTSSPVWEGTLHRNQFHFDDKQLHSSGQLWNTVSPLWNFFVQMWSQEVIFAWSVFPIIHHEVYLSGIKQKRWAEENRRDWSHRGYEESCQARNKLFLWWVRHLCHCCVLFYDLYKHHLGQITFSSCLSSGENICRWCEFCFLFLNITVLPYSPYWILSTDYVNTAVVYSCTDILRLFHVDFAWILGRTRTLPDATIETAREVFAKNNIDVSRMIPSKQQGCDKFL